MIRARLSFLGAALVLAQVVGSPSRALAWDSVPEARMPTMPHQVWPYAFPASQADQRQFYMQYLKDAIGGMATGYGDVTTKLLRCPADAVVVGANGIAGCAIATQRDLLDSHGQWMTSRAVGSIPHKSEHTLLAREAARRAGLLRDAVASSGPEIFEPFWVRYPAHNQFIASAIGPDSSDPPAAYVVGQSQRPVDLGTPGASFVARQVALLELAQLPDFSNSLADWAMGNETCPLAGTERAYANVYPTEACHAFTAAMGAINVTHFAPLNRDMWRHYHGLALAKMAECVSYLPIRQQFYQGWPSSDFIPESETEVHECERVAMAYEMFAQHFMQDAWSSGHMWRAWGQSRFGDFPADVQLFPNEAPPDFSPLSEPGRRAMVAATIGIARGMIHGAKALTAKLGEDLFREANDPLVRLGAFDDPLNSGTYSTFRVADLAWHESDVRWLDPQDGNVPPAAGDLFWDPTIVTGAVVSQQPKFYIQRERLLNCSAKSMLEVYQVGPRAAGEPQGQLAELDAVVPDSEQCWGQWATNASMLGSLGPFDAKYVTLDRLMLGTLLQLVNSATIASVGFSVVSFPEGPYFALERVRMTNRVMAAFSLDLEKIKQVYLHNAEEREDGTQSAQQHHLDDPAGASPLRFLGVPPAESGAMSDPPRGVDYVDTARAPGDTSEGALALSRMFWRGELRRSCGLTGLAQLQQACVAALQHGGNAEACTACVAQAELHVPSCSLQSQSLDHSKCSAALAETGASGAPAWWSDAFLRMQQPGSLPPPFNVEDVAQCDSSMRMALKWCTETPANQFPRDGNLVSWHRGTDAPTDTDTCGATDGYVFTWGRSEWRGARFLTETPRNTRPWIYPMAVGYDYSVTTEPGDDKCDLVDYFTTSRDSIIDHDVRPAVSSEYLSRFAAGAEVPRCGVTQRVYDWNRPCSEAREQVAVDMPDDVELDHFYGDSGASVVTQVVNGEPVNCLTRLPRAISTCPAGFQCTAGGECVAGGGFPSTPPFVLLDPRGAAPF